MDEAVDPCSLSNPDEVLVKHWHWLAEPSFSNKTISATIDLQICVLKENAEKLVNEIPFIMHIKNIIMIVFVRNNLCS